MGSLVTRVLRRMGWGSVSYPVILMDVREYVRVMEGDSIDTFTFPYLILLLLSRLFTLAGTLIKAKSLPFI